MKNHLLLSLVGKSLEGYTIESGHIVSKYNLQGEKIGPVGFFFIKEDAIGYTHKNKRTKRENALILTNGKEFYSLEGRLVLPIPLTKEVNFSSKLKVTKKKGSA